VIATPEAVGSDVIRSAGVALNPGDGMEVVFNFVIIAHNRDNLSSVGG
jgi:hypothetical protein